MSDRPRRDGGRLRGLDALIVEAKQDLTPRVEDEAWNAVEDRIVARMAAERSAPPSSASASSSLVSLASRRGSNVLRIGAAVLAAAAAVIVIVKSDPGASRDGASRGDVTQTTELTAGMLRSTEGAGEVRVGGQLATMGHALRAGEIVETGGGARAILERPSKVDWLLERNATDGAPVARARVKSAGEALILGLEDGAIEAQVTPVPSGEAFAVDIAAGNQLVRVAVHGTHLRVSRTGSRVVVDLTEGVVSIGVPPRTGSTYGTLVTAPSHVEFDAADLNGTLRIDHTAATVRPAIPLGPQAATAAHVAADPGHTNAPAPAPASEEHVAPANATVPRPVAAPRSATDPSSHVDPPPPVDPAAPTPPNVPPRDSIAAAVRQCAAARRTPASTRVTVTSALKLKIGANGSVETAQFDPPLLPEIQTCAATAIYKAKLEDAAGGTVTIPLNFSY